ncbi:hypothetical protein ACLMAJ_16445 [Nocardia sp. KC 131]|uniref:hypothetical protein n=1 Tax=Nocardia arseniciresistens TaxID=3392119 RepID=UPI00398E32EB
MVIQAGGLVGIGHVIGTRLSGATNKVSYFLAEGKLVPISSQLRQAAQEYIEKDSHGKAIIQRTDLWTVPELPRKIIPGETPIWGTDPYTFRELALWPGDLSKEVLYDRQGEFIGLSYPLEREDIPHLRNLAEDGSPSKYSHTTFDSTGHSNMTNNPWITPWSAEPGAFYIHAEANAETSTFHIRADLPTFDQMNQHPGGEIIALEPEVLAKQVSTEPELRKAVARSPKSAIVMLSGDIGRHDMAARFAQSLQEEEGFRRDIYFSNGPQIVWLDPPTGWNPLSIQEKAEGGLRDGWTRYAPAPFEAG